MNADERRSEENVMRMLDDVLARLRGGLYDIEEGNLPRAEARRCYEMARRALEAVQPIAAHTREVDGDSSHRIHGLETKLLGMQDRFRELMD